MTDLPANEYDSYAPQVVALFRDGADDLRVAQHLSDVEERSMGLGPMPPEKLLPVVRLLRAAAVEAE